MIIFQNQKQARKVRWVLLGSVLWVAGLLYWAWLSAETYGLSPGDGGVLKPASTRYAMACLLVVIGLVPFAAMIIYARLYLIRIERQRDSVLLVTIGLLSEGHHIYAPDDFLSARDNEGRWHGRISVNAPWTSLYVAGRRLPYIVDLQAEHVNGSAITALARRGTTKPRRVRRGT